MLLQTVRLLSCLLTDHLQHLAKSRFECCGRWSNIGASPAEVPGAQQTVLQVVVSYKAQDSLVVRNEPEGVRAVRAMTKQSKRTRVSDQSRLFEDNVLLVRAFLLNIPQLPACIESPIHLGLDRKYTTPDFFLWVFLPPPAKSPPPKMGQQ